VITTVSRSQPRLKWKMMREEDALQAAS